MPRGGGPRPGAGRPKGSLNKRTQEIVARAAESGLTPLEVLLEGMRNAYDKKDWENAHKFATAAAPYMHPRLQAHEHGGAGGGQIIVNIVKFSDGSRNRSTVQLEAAPLPARPLGLS